MMKKLFPLFALTIFLFSCANMFQDKVNMPRGGTSVSLYHLVGGEVKLGPLDAPAEIFVSLYDYSDRIQIGWTPVDHAAYYRLERAVVTQKKADGTFAIPEDGDFELLEHSKSISGTSYVDTIIKDDVNDPLDSTNPKYGYAYFYRVSAENPLGGYDESEFTTSSMAALLAPPATVKGSLGESQDFINVSWIKVPGAIRYEIYRGLYSDGSNSSRVGTITSNQNWFKDESVDKSFQGQDLYYTVCSVGTKGTKSVKSSVALGYTLLPGAPGQVSGVVVEKGRGNVTANEGISIKWDAAGSGVLYAVYRSSSTDSSLTKLKDGLTTTKYIDTKKLNTNTYYYYYVQAYSKEDDGSINKGQMSDSGPNCSDKANSAEGFILSPPPSIKVDKILGNTDICHITFAAAIGNKGYINDSKIKSDYQNYTYKVMGSNSESGPFDQNAGSFTVSAEPDKDGNYEGDVAAYPYYKMRTVNGAVESAESSVVAPAPYAATDVYVTRAELVGDYSGYGYKSPTEYEEAGANSNNVHPVRITWNEPSGGADGGYYIYRSTSKDSGYRRINDNPVTSLSYIDAFEGAKARTIYYYKVLSLNSLSQGSNYSEVDEPELDENGFIKIKDSLGNRYGKGFGWGAITVYQYMREHVKTTLYSQSKLTLMHKGSNTDKLGSESTRGDISGTLSYSAKIDGLGGRVIMEYKNYADFYVVDKNKDSGLYFFLNGNTNTSASMSGSGSMDGKVTVQGMYPGYVVYDSIEIKNNKAGGGVYRVVRAGIDSEEKRIDWNTGEK